MAALYISSLFRRPTQTCGTRRVGGDVAGHRKAAIMRRVALALAGLAAAAAVLHLGRKKKRQQPEDAATGVIFTGTGAAETFAFSVASEPSRACSLAARARFFSTRHLSIYRSICLPIYRMLDGPTDDKVHPEREAGGRLELRHVPPRAAQRPRRSQLAEQRGRAAPLPPRRRHVRPRAGRDRCVWDPALRTV